MNEQTEQNINEAIDWLQQTGGSIQDFATSQAPLYCQEVVAWTFWKGLTCTLIGVFLLVLCAIFAKQICPAWRSFKESKEPLQYFEEPLRYFEEPWAAIRWSVLTVVFFILGFTFVCNNIGNTIKAKVAPRLVIVEHFKKLPR